MFPETSRTSPGCRATGFNCAADPSGGLRALGEQSPIGIRREYYPVARNQRGFSLVELLTVIAVLAILLRAAAGVKFRAPAGSDHSVRRSAQANR